MTFGSASPDESVVAVTYRDDEQRAIRMAILSADGRVVSKGLVFPGRTRWSADSHAVDYTDVRDGVWNIWRRPIDGSAPTQLTKFTGSDVIYNFAWSRDGKQLAVTRGHSTSDVVTVSSVP